MLIGTSGVMAIFLLCVLLAGCGQNPHVTGEDPFAMAEPGTATTVTVADPGSTGEFPPGIQKGWQQEPQGKMEQAPPTAAIGRIASRIVMLDDGTPVLLDVFVPAQQCIADCGEPRHEP